MSRWVVPKRATLTSASTTAPEADTRLYRIAKYVPAEVLGGFTLASTLLAGQPDSYYVPWAAIALIVLFLVVTVIYLARRVQNQQARKAHLIVSPLAFVAWAYPISSSALGDLFVPLIAFLGQALVIGLSILIQPIES